MARQQLGAKSSRFTDAATLADVANGPGFKGAIRMVGGDQAMLAGEEVSLAFGNVTFDSGGFTSSVAGDALYKIPEGGQGVYRLDLRFVVDNYGISGGVAIILKINGASVREYPLQIASGAGTYMASPSDIFTFSVGDVVSMKYYSNVEGMTLRSSDRKTTQSMLQLLT